MSIICVVKDFQMCKMFLLSQYLRLQKKYRAAIIYWFYKSVAYLLPQAQFRIEKY